MPRRSRTEMAVAGEQQQRVGHPTAHQNGFSSSTPPTSTTAMTDHHRRHHQEASISSPSPPPPLLSSPKSGLSAISAGADRTTLAAATRIRRSEAATNHFRAGRYLEAAALYESALHDASCNDPAVVMVVESTTAAASSTTAAISSWGRDGGGGGGIGNAGGAGGRGERLDAELVVDITNRAATAHNLGLAREMLPGRGGGGGNNHEGGTAAADGNSGTATSSRNEDPLLCYRRAADLYKLCHAAVLSGRVKNVAMMEREQLDAVDGKEDIRQRRTICVEASAVQSILAAAASFANRSDVDGTIGCHEEIVSFLLGVDEDDENSQEEEEDGPNNNINNGDGGLGGVGGGDQANEADILGGAPDDENDDQPGRLTPSSTSASSTSGGDNAAPSGGNASSAAAPLFVQMDEHQRMRLISNSLNALGNLYARRGDDEDAIASYTDALDLLRSIEEPVGIADYPIGSGDETCLDDDALEIDVRDDIARTLLSLSALHGRRDEVDEAIEYGEEALDVLSDRHGDTHDIVVGRPGDDEKDEAKLVQLQGSGDGKRHPAVLSALHALGRTYDLLAGDFDAAMSCYEDAFLGRVRSIGCDDLSVADVLVDMASALQRTGNVDGALELNSQALRIYRLYLPKEDCKGMQEGEARVAPDDEPKFTSIGPQKCKIYIAGALQNRGALYMQRNDHDDALDCYAEAMEIIKNARGEDHPEVASLWTVMGDANVVRERYDLAKDCYAAALEAHRMRGLEDTDSPVLWMLQKIRVIEDIVASALQEDEEFLEELATRAGGARDRSTSLIEVLDDVDGSKRHVEEKDQKKVEAVFPDAQPQDADAIERAGEEFLNELATKVGSEPDDSSQHRAERQEQDDEAFMNELATTNGAQSPEVAALDEIIDEQVSSFLEEEEAFLAELASGTMSDGGDGASGNIPTAGGPVDANVVSSPPKPKPILKKNSSFTGRIKRKQTDNQEHLEPKDVETPAGIQMIVPDAKSADDTVSVITFKEEKIMEDPPPKTTRSSTRDKRRATYREQDDKGHHEKDDWLANALGNIVEATAQATDTFLRPLATDPQKGKGQAPISEVTFANVGEGQDIARTLSAESDITDIMDEYGGPMPSAAAVEDDDGEDDDKNVSQAGRNEAAARVPPAQATDDQDIGENIGIEVDELLAQMNVSASSEDNDAALPKSSPRQAIAAAKNAIANAKVATMKSNAEYAAFSPRTGKKKKARKTANTAEIKALKNTLEQQRGAANGPISEEVASTLTSLGNLYKNEGDLDSALEVYTQELDVRRNVFGPGHFSVADALNRMGVIRLEKDEFDAAKECHTQALQIQQACLGENEHNPDVSRTLVNLGDVYYKERNSLKKIKSNNNSITDYDDVIESGMLCRIAFAHDERGDYVRAMHFYDEHVELLKSKGENKYIPGIINALNCLGSLNKKTGRYVEALDYHTKAYHMQKSLPGIDKVECANTSVLIGMVQHKSGYFKMALSLFSDALPVQQKAYGKKHAIPARTLFHMALVHDELADHAKAMSLLEQALSIQKSVLPPDHPDTLSTRMYIARLHSCAGMYDVAMTSLLGVLLSQKQLFGPKHPCVADTLHNIGICHARRGKMNSALKSYEQCFTIRKETLGYEHPDIAAVLNSIAAVHASKKRNEKALPIYEAALKIRRDALGDNHVDVARTLSNQGVAYAALRKFPQALKVYNQAKKIRENALGPFHPACADSHVNIGNVYLRKCAFTEARCEFEAALYIYNKSHLRPDDPKINRTRAIIDRVKRDEKLCV